MNTQPITELTIGLEPTYPYYLGDGVLSHFPEYLAQESFDKIIVVSSAVPFGLFGRVWLETLRRCAQHVSHVVIDDREIKKNWNTLANLCEALIEQGVTRDTILISVGGGVVGNVVGLAAGLIFRGIRYIEVPTTLMAQTDSVLSRKQAINGATGKNQFGLYHTPLFVWADVAYTRREPLRQTRSAIVEAVKNGLVNDPVWLDELSSRLADGLERVRDDLRDFTLRMVRSKLGILAKDPSERGAAIVLEYGHTFGHAIEWLSQGTVLHGEAVAMGMCAAGRLSHSLGIMPRSVLDLHYEVLDRLLGAPVQVPPEFDPADICSTMLRDNKRGRSGLCFLLLEEPGRMHRSEDSYLTPASAEEILEALNAIRAVAA